MTSILIWGKYPILAVHMYIFSISMSINLQSGHLKSESGTEETVAVMPDMSIPKPVCLLFELKLCMNGLNIFVLIELFYN